MANVLMSTQTMCTHNRILCPAFLLIKHLHVLALGCRKEQQMAVCFSQGFLTSKGKARWGAVCVSVMY